MSVSLKRMTIGQVSNYAAHSKTSHMLNCFASARSDVYGTQTSLSDNFWLRSISPETINLVQQS